MFDRIPKPGTSQEYLDTALSHGRIAASRVKRISDAVILRKAKERDRIRAIRDSVLKALQRVHDSYPSFDSLGEFTVHVFSLDMDPGRAKQALGGIHSNIDRIRELTQEHLTLIGKHRDVKAVQKTSNAYMGRLGSILKQTEKHLRVLDEARTVFRQLPTVDESLFTVAIAGFPNVGKSTLLKKMTTASPEVQPYAFTTKGLNVGYFEYLYNKIQCVDTPGTLNRKEMNAIERKADLAMKYLADVIVYIFDPTESYPMERQETLHQKILGLDKDVIVYVSKTDLVETDIEGLTDPEELRKELTKRFKRWL